MPSEKDEGGTPFSAVGFFFMIKINGDGDKAESFLGSHGKNQSQSYLSNRYIYSKNKLFPSIKG